MGFNMVPNVGSDKCSDKYFNFTLPIDFTLPNFNLVGLNLKRLTPLTCMCMGT
jgi:hypothetical protein